MAFGAGDGSTDPAPDDASGGIVDVLGDFAGVSGCAAFGPGALALASGASAVSAGAPLGPVSPGSERRGVGV